MSSTSSVPCDEASHSPPRLDGPGKPGRRWLLAAVLVALALDLVFFTGFYGSDDRTYIDAAGLIQDGERIPFEAFGATRFGVILPMAGVLRVFDDNLFALGCLFIVYHLVLVLLAACLGRLLHGAVAGLVAALLVAIWPALVHESSLILPDMQMACTVVAGLTLLLAARRQWEVGHGGAAYALLFGAGAALMLGFMVKVAMVIYVPAFGLYVLTFPPRGGSPAGPSGLAAWARRVVPLGLVLCAGFALSFCLDLLLQWIHCGEIGMRLGQVRGYSDDYKRIAAAVDASSPIARLRMAADMLESAYRPAFWWPLVVGVAAYPFLPGRSWMLVAVLAWGFLFRTVGSVSLSEYAPPTIQTRYYTAHVVMGLVMLGHGVAVLRARLAPAGDAQARRRVATALIVCWCVLLAVSMRRLDKTVGTFGYAEQAWGLRAAVAVAFAQDPDAPFVLSQAMTYRMHHVVAAELDDGRVLRGGATQWPAPVIERFWYVHGVEMDRLEATHATPLDTLLQSGDGDVASDGRLVRWRSIGRFSPPDRRRHAIRQRLPGGKEAANEAGTIAGEEARREAGVHLWFVEIVPLDAGAE